MLSKKCTLEILECLKRKKEINMSDYIDDLLEVGFDDFDDDCDDAVEM
jgi:hypothetical protein